MEKGIFSSFIFCTSNPFKSCFFNSKYSADEFLKMISFVSRYSSSSSRHNIDSILQQMEFGSGSAFFKEILPKKKTVMNANGDLVEEEELEFSSSDDLSIYVIIDPLTTAAQRASSLMQIIRDQLRLPQNLILAPRVEVTGIYLYII